MWIESFFLFNLKLYNEPWQFQVPNVSAFVLAFLYVLFCDFFSPSEMLKINEKEEKSKHVYSSYSSQIAEHLWVA